MTRHWFDWAATALPLKEEQEHCLEEALSFCGNPSSQHSEGLAAKKFLEKMRSRAADALALPPSELVFTSGATEANQIILYSLLAREKHSALVTSRAEHPSTKAAALVLERTGYPVTYLPLDPCGRVRQEALEKLVERERDIRMITLMAVQNETGGVSAFGELIPALRKAAEKRAQSLHIHCDAVQIIGKLPFNPAALDLDSMSVSAHKLGGPRGAGLLWSRKELSSIFTGGGQEKGLRGGTENLFAAAGIAAALGRSLEKESIATGYHRACAHEEAILGNLPPTVSVFPAVRSLRDEAFSPFIISLKHRDLPAEAVVRLLDARGIAVSSSSACSSSKGRRDVLEAMGIRGEDALKVFRVSTGQSTTERDIEALMSTLNDL